MATAKSVLVVTSTTGFGELIQQALETTGLYKVMLVDSDQEALLCIQAVAFSIAILDSELPYASLIPLATSMRQKLPRMRLIIICSKDDPAFPSVEAFHPEGLLNKPFYLPDLLDTVAKALQISPEAAKAPPESVAPMPAPSPLLPNHPAVPEWLQDVSRAAQHLTRLSLESDAQAALILKDGSLWAYAGQLTQPATQELSERLAAFWYFPPETGGQPGSPRGHTGDMVRFFRLESTEGEYMVYATSLGGGMVLSLAFDSETPFSTIRTQAGYLVKALSAPPGTQLPPAPRSRAVRNPANRPIDPGAGRPSNLPPLLDDIPNPSPHKSHSHSATTTPLPDWIADASTSDQSEDEQTSELDNAPISSRSQPMHTHPATGTARHSSIDLRPTTPALHSLTYAGMLIPRLPQHLLRGDLARHLSEWLEQLCLAFGWQLEQINVQPEYLQCIIRVNPITSPSYLMRIIRQQTSQRIFIAFPLLIQDNPSGDFWAPGYLIISNSQLPPPNITQHFLEQTRQQQGVQQPASLRQS